MRYPNHTLIYPTPMAISFKNLNLGDIVLMDGGMASQSRTPDIVSSPNLNTMAGLDTGG
jgi:hypothetical protein